MPSFLSSLLLLFFFFAFRFPLFVLWLSCSCYLAYLVYLFCFCGSLGVLLGFLFPLRTIRKKKGRAVLVRPLFVCCERSDSCNVIEELRGRCFGSF